MVTPARRQYLEMKAQHPDAILWFRMGDFYAILHREDQYIQRLEVQGERRDGGRGSAASTGRAKILSSLSRFAPYPQRIPFRSGEWCQRAAR